MQKTFITSLFTLFFLPCFSQLNFDVHSTLGRSVTQQTLSGAKTMNDITPGYPSSWISNYISVEIAAMQNGTEIKALGKNDTLTNEQKNLLATSALGTDIHIDVKYTYYNNILGTDEFQNMNFVLTVAPETQAEYVGGYAQMSEYLKENAIDKISESKAKKEFGAIIRFTVDEKGAITNSYIAQSSHDKKTDKLLLKALHKMPKWNAAQLANGTKVKQEFEFKVGSPKFIGC